MSPDAQGRLSKRSSLACEHCRIARIKCQASGQPGVCLRCLASKRECISRTKPRPRRAKRSLGAGYKDPSPQPPGHLGTFSIRYTVPNQARVDDSLDILRDIHESALDSLLSIASPSQTESIRGQSTSSSANQHDPISDIWRQPLFDVASAESLLHAFKSMANYLPFIVLPDQLTVLNLATEKPFLLLSILTVASGSTMVQRHALYEDEFLKALGLKYVSNGEKSLELLQGLLIYCAWYPFHLQPKSEQLGRCIRMVSELVHSLGINQDYLTMLDSLSPEVAGEEVDKIRAHLAYLCILSTYVSVWKGESDLRIDWPSWAGTAIHTLQRYAQVNGDHSLVAQARLSSIFHEARKAIHERDSQTRQDCGPNIVGIETQYHDLRLSMDSEIMAFESTRIQAMFIEIFLDCGSLLNFPVAKTPISNIPSRAPPSSSKLYSAVNRIGLFLDYVAALGDRFFLSSTVNDWTRLIVILTLSFRLSFPLRLCPDLDSANVRAKLRLDQFLSKMSDTPGPTASGDLLSVSRAMFGLAKEKYKRRLDSLGEQLPAAQASRVFGCPVMNGGLRTLVNQRGASSLITTGGGQASPWGDMPALHDIWSIMTMGWDSISDIGWHTIDDGLFPAHQL